MSPPHGADGQTRLRPPHRRDARPRGGLRHYRPEYEDRWTSRTYHAGLRPDTVLSFFAEDPERNIAPVLDQVRVPTLVIHGTADHRVPFDGARYLAEHIPGARLYPFGGSGHLPLVRATRPFCEALHRRPAGPISTRRSSTRSSRSRPSSWRWWAAPAP
ncbi:MAG: alpha/beta fold hydrolase [Candidatus Rokubacteria bacterium]|nr:alpha/beta fold hydrolase [Candidatus Rokubacteria bacterium]